MHGRAARTPLPKQAGPGYHDDVNPAPCELCKLAMLVRVIHFKCFSCNLGSTCFVGLNVTCVTPPPLHFS